MLKRILTPVIFAMGLGALTACNGGGTTTTTSVKTPVIIDTDVGFDDAMAISYVLNHKDKLNLLAIAIAGDGETYCQQGYDNVKAILENFDSSNTPVTCGPSTPLKGNNVFPLFIRQQAVEYAAGDLPVKTLPLPTISASELMYKEILSSYAPVEILEIAPQTNLAQLLIDHPDVKAKIKGVTIMGGAVGVPGNVQQVEPSNPNNTAEFNYYIDPYAASIVMKSGLNLTMVPLNFTKYIPLNLMFYNVLESTEKNKFNNFIMSVMTKIHSLLNQGFLSFWDPAAAVVLLNQNEVAGCAIQKLTVNADYTSAEGGTVSVDNINGNDVNVCTSLKVSVSKFYQIFLKPSHNTIF